MDIYESVGYAYVLFTSMFGTLMLGIAALRHIKATLKSADDNERIRAAWISRGLREFALDDEQHRKALSELEWVRRQMENP